MDVPLSITMNVSSPSLLSLLRSYTGIIPLSMSLLLNQQPKHLLNPQLLLLNLQFLLLNPQLLLLNLQFLLLNPQLLLLLSANLWK